MVKTKANIVYKPNERRKRKYIETMHGTNKINNKKWMFAFYSAFSKSFVPFFVNSIKKEKKTTKKIDEYEAIGTITGMNKTIEIDSN